MGLMNEVKGGADLTHPKASIGWATGAIIAVFILLIVVGIASYMYKMGKSALSGAGKTATAGMFAGAFGDGT